MIQPYRIPISAQHLRYWSAILVSDVAPFFLTAALADQLPSAIPRFPRDMVAQMLPNLSFRDSYTTYAVDTSYPVVVFLRHADLAALTDQQRQALLLAQWQSGRGQVYAWEHVQHFFDTARLQYHAAQYCLDTAQGCMLVLDQWLWQHLPAATRHAWLRQYIDDVQHPYPTYTLPESIIAEHTAHTKIGRPGEHRPIPARERARSAQSIVPELSNRFSYHSGPNCFASTLAAATPSLDLARTISQLWLHQPAFLEGILARGYQAQVSLSPCDPSLRNSIAVWQNPQGQTLHACWIIGDGLALNKNAQAWYAPWHIARMEHILAYWAEDDLRCVVYFMS